MKKWDRIKIPNIRGSLSKNNNKKVDLNIKFLA